MIPILAAFLGLQAFGAAAQARAADDEGRAKQSYYNWLATNDEVQAGRVEAAGEEQVTGIQNVALQQQIALERDTKKLQGAQTTILASHGIWGNSRTAQDIAKDTITQEGRDISALRYNADVKSWETRVNASEQARALREGAVGYRMGGDQARRKGRTEAVGSIISGATSIGNTWLNWTNARTPRG